MIVFMILAFLGFFFLVVTLFFGTIFEGIEDVAHDISLDHDLSLDHDTDVAGPSPFSIRILAAFITGFGASGAISSYYHKGWMVSSFIGLLFGALTGGIVYLVVSMMYKQQASSTISMDEMVGLAGVVSVTIPPKGFGQVSLVVKSSQVEHFASSESGDEIKNGTNVKVVKLVGDRLIVSPLA